MAREKDGAVRARKVPGGGYHARYRHNGSWLRVLKADGTPALYRDAVHAAASARLAYACAVKAEHA